MTKKVLVVDDETDVLELVKSILSKKGYEVTTDFNGDQVEKITENFPHLIMLDIGLLGKDGTEICKKLKSQPATKDIPILFFSADIDLAYAAHESGANDFLCKPFDISSLLNSVEKNLRVP